MLNSALHLVERGWPILPLLPRDKRPYYALLPEVDGGRSWTPLRDGVDAAEVRRWFDYNPDLNIGIITGRGLVVADVDRPGKLGGLGFPPTPMAETSRGYHVYLDGRGLDIERGKFAWGEVIANGYVVAPPSIHESGAAYTWYPFLSYADVHLARVPDALLRDKKTTPKTAPRKNILSRCSLKGETWVTQGKGAHSDLAGDWETARAILRKCGADPKAPGRAFKCPLPGHSEKHASAALWRPEGDGGFFSLHDFHFRDKAAWWPLPDVYASCCAGKARQLKSGERAIWWLRALADIGAIEVPAVRHHDLPGDARGSVRKLYDGFIYLLALRKVYDPKQTQAAPFTWTFAQGWCGIGSRHTVQASLNWLFKRGYLYKCGKTTGRGIGLLALGKPRELKGDRE